jgi:hypothetical protein
MNQFGRGEYGFLKYDNGLVMTDIEVFEKRILSCHDIKAADEAGNETPFEYLRRADDHTIIDGEWRGLRDHSSCWDHNQTVDAMLHTYWTEKITLYAIIICSESLLQPLWQ